jgi:hypothetical protein
MRQPGAALAACFAGSRERSWTLKARLTVGKEMVMNAVIEKEIESLRKLKTRALKTRYRELFGEESPSSNQLHLFRRIAWRLQAEAEGQLSERARQRAWELAQDADLRVRAPRAFWDTLGANPAAPEGPSNRDPRLPAPGSTLKRTHRGRPLVVEVLERGFRYNGKIYGSLSAIAYQVTGTRWNGFLFFADGLNTGVDHA